MRNNRDTATRDPARRAADRRQAKQVVQITDNAPGAVLHPVRRSTDPREGEHIAQLLETVPDALLIAGADGEILVVNRHLLKLFEYAKDELLGQKVELLIPEHRRANHAAHRAGFAAQPSVRQMGNTARLAGRKKSGVEFPAEISLSPISYFGRSAVSATVRDVTARLNRDRQLREAKNMHDVLFQNSDLAVFDLNITRLFDFLAKLDAKGVTDVRAYVLADPERLKELAKTTRLNTVNPAALKLLGIASIDELGTIDFVQDGNYARRVLDIAEAVLRGDERLRNETEYTSATGESIPVIQTLRIPASVEEAHSVPVLMIDLRDYRRAEVERQANLAKSRFLATMSHEIRTPLHGVVANIDLLQRTALDGEQKSLASSAQEAADMLLHLIGDILDFSKIEANRVELERVPINVPDFIWSVDSVLRPKARLNKLTFVSRLGPDVPEVVEGDPLRLRQVLMNIVGNALRHTSRGGVQCNVGVERADDAACTLRFDVYDSGAGLDPKASAGIFDAFTQTKTSAQGGTGLGLAVAKSLVELWGGKIGFDGAPGEGAHFWFTMPARVVEKAPAPKPVAESAHALGRTLILLLAGQSGDEVEAFFRERNAEYAIADSLTAACGLADEYAAKGKPFRNGIVHAGPDGVPSPEIAAELRRRDIMPSLQLLEYGPCDIRRALRAGFKAAYSSVDASATVRHRALEVIARHTGTQDVRTLDRWNDKINSVEELSRNPARDKLRILVLEDQPMNQMVIGRQLTRLGIKHDIARNGVEGLRLLPQAAYDLILSDCSMPEMDGYEFTARVRDDEKSEHRARTPIIAVTANAFVDDMAKCKAVGMDDFLTKPTSMDMLASKILQWSRIGNAGGAGCPAPAAAEKQSPGEAAEPLDLKVLPASIGADDKASLSVAYALFVSESNRHVEQIKDHAARRNAVELGRVAHGTKGDARSAGAHVLGESLARLEKIAKTQDWEGIDTLVAGIAAEHRRVIDYIQVRKLAEPA